MPPRFIEAGHGFVKVLSWMHCRWLLCSTNDGLVGTCNHAESFKDYRSEEAGKSDSPSRPYICSEWAIEKSPDGEGVIIRSKTHARLLCVRDNYELRTWHPDDEAAAAEDDEDEDAAEISPDDGKKGNWQSFTSSMRDSIEASLDDDRKKMTH